MTPLGLGAKQPRLSWKITSDKRDVVQAAYEIQVSTTKDPGKGDAWSTGKVASDQSTNITYQGQELKSTTHYFSFSQLKFHLQLKNSNPFLFML